MDKIKTKIEDRIRKLNYNLPESMVHGISDRNLLQAEIKRYRSKNIQARFRNFLIVALAFAITALIIGKESYYYVIAAAAVAAIILLSPSARYTRNLSLARQKLFLMELLEDMNVQLKLPSDIKDVAFDED